MKKIYKLLCIALFMGHFSLFGFSVSGFSAFKQQMTGIGQGFKQFGEGMAESFGMNPPGYHYSFRVFNNSNSTITAEAKRLKKYQGMMIKRDSISKHPVGPAEDSGESGFSSINIYLSVVIPGGNHQIVNMIPSYKKNDDTYCFNIFQNSSGVHNEFIGVNKTTNDQFLGSIYNALTTTQNLVFPYANQSFSVDLDKTSYNLLQSDTDIPNCIRPGSLDFGSSGTVNLPQKGLATGEKKGGQWTDLKPMGYHYEIIKTPTGGLAVTNGFNPGNFAQATNQRIRSLTPVRCLVWNKSAKQAVAGQGLVAVDQKTRTVWVAYSTPGWTNKTRNISDTIMYEVPSGEALQFWFIRPSIDADSKLTTAELLKTKNLTPTKKFTTNNTVSSLGVQLHPADIFTSVKDMAPTTAKAPLFIVSLDTTDSTKAKAFLQNLIDGKIPIPQGPSLSSSKLTEDIKSTLLANKLSTTLGQLTDSSSGVSGYLLAHDTFTPYGNGPGPYYYSVQPPQIMIAPILSTLMSYINKKL